MISPAPNPAGLSAIPTVSELQPLVVIWREANTDDGGAPDLVFATIRYPSDEGGRFTATPYFCYKDVPSVFGWHEEDLLRAFLEWGMRCGIAESGITDSVPTAAALAEARAPFLEEISRVATILTWANALRTRLVADGHLLAYSPDAAWNAYLTGGETSLRALFTDAVNRLGTVRNEQKINVEPYPVNPRSIPIHRSSSIP